MKISYNKYLISILDAAPDITQFNNTRRGADRVTRYVNVSQTEPGDTSKFSFHLFFVQQFKFGNRLYFV